MAQQYQVTTTYTDLYALLGKTVDTEITIQIVDGTVLIDDEATPAAGFKFRKGEWAYIKASQAWIKSATDNATIVG